MSLRTASSITSAVVATSAANENRLPNTPPIYIEPSALYIIYYYVQSWRTIFNLLGVCSDQAKRVKETWGI